MRPRETRGHTKGGSRVKRTLATACMVFSVSLAGALFPITTVGASSHATKQYRSAVSTAQAYFQLLNRDMMSGDFSDLGTVFSSGATLTKSGTDGKTAVYQGLSQITGYYQSLYQKVPKWQWTTDELRPLSNRIVLAYEHAGSPPLSVASRCIHVFVIRQGKIVSYDWAAFYPGQP